MKAEFVLHSTTPMIGSMIVRRRVMEIERAPSNGSTVILADPDDGKRKAYLVTGVTEDMDRKSPVSVHVMAHENLMDCATGELFGVASDWQGYISSPTGFDGRTVGDLIAFLMQYPLEYEVQVDGGGTLVTHGKHQALRVRIDDPED